MSFFNTVLSPVAIKAGADAKAAATEATVNAIKKLAQKPTATMPDVTVAAPPAPAGLLDKWKALPTWMRYTAYAIGALAVMKAAAPSGD
jgi:hypothetical protein